MSASHEKRPTEEEQKRQHERQHPISSGQQGHGPNFCLILNPVFFSGLMALEKVGLWVWRFHTATSFWHWPHLPWFHRNLTGHFRSTCIQAEKPPGNQLRENPHRASQEDTPSGWAAVNLDAGMLWCLPWQSAATEFRAEKCQKDIHQPYQAGADP